MTEQIRGSATVLAVVAHPDDETFGCGALIAHLADTGHRVIVCSASRGELGEDALDRDLTAAQLGEVREREMRAAAAILGADVELLGFTDSGWDGEPPAGSIIASPQSLTRAIAARIDDLRPNAVITMDPSDGHRDHAAVGVATTDAFESTVRWPASLYHWCLPRSLMRAWIEQISAGDPDSVYVHTDLGRPDAEVTTTLDNRDLVTRVQAAMAEHRSQTSPFADVDAELETRFIGFDHLVRIHPPGCEHHESQLFIPARMRADA